MPHQCTACGHTFADGSKDMLSGCPDCGGNKFQFYPPGTDVPDEPPEGVEADAPEPDAEPSGAASTVGRAATRVRDFVSSDPAPGADADSAGSPNTDPDPDAPWPDSSDAADPIRKGGVVDDDAGNPGAAEASAGADTGVGASADVGAADEGAADEGEDIEDMDEGEDIIDADARTTRDAVTDAEDLAQSDARSGLASEAEVEAAANRSSTRSGEADAPGAPGSPAGESEAPAEASGDLEAAEATVDREDRETPPLDRDGRVVSEPTGEEPDISELRDQLNDQFESIKILEPGQYELNLMELYDREEYIIALQENGRYVIQVPENWMGDRPGE